VQQVIRNARHFIISTFLNDICAEPERRGEALWRDS
jgi:hypothetical protein